ncbi:MAG TPA: MJ1255/VC2487 family glycosyltransferase [Thermoanaerobaculia bacterium]|jgi:uncharacterized protein (TIGR00661 family)
MKILYGVVGEGMGHAMRSRVVLERLVAQGHEIHVMASSRAADFLAARFSGVRRIHGLHIVYEENRMLRGRTLWSNLVAGTAALPDNVAAYFELIREFRPGLVISDFESWTWVFAKLHRLPILSIDNQQIIGRCLQPAEVIQGHEADFQLTRAFIRAKLPRCNHYLVTTFFHPETCRPRTTLIPPILRPEILAARPRRGDHLLVYQTAEGHQGLLTTLAGTGLECRIYGLRRGIQEEQVEGSLRFRPFSEAGFIEDLATARAVIAGGGFTTLGEAIYLRKPTLSVPVGGQLEQVLNARWLERLGYGRAADALDPAAIHGFLQAVPGCEERLAGYEQDGNERLYAELDRQLERLA